MTNPNCAHCGHPIGPNPAWDGEPDLAPWWHLGWPSLGGEIPPEADDHEAIPDPAARLCSEPDRVVLIADVLGIIEEHLGEYAGETDVDPRTRDEIAFAVVDRLRDVIVGPSIPTAREGSR